MRISFGQHSLRVKDWSSEVQMFEFLRSSGAEYILLGEDARQYDGFFSTEVLLGFAGKDSLRVGLISEGHGLLPHLLLIPERDQLLFGFNEQVACVNVNERSVVFRIRLESLFRSFLRLKAHALILAFHEIGVTALDENGNVEWSYAKDIVEDCVLSQFHLDLKFLDEPTVRIDL